MSFEDKDFDEEKFLDIKKYFKNYPLEEQEYIKKNKERAKKERSKKQSELKDK